VVQQPERPDISSKSLSRPQWNCALGSFSRVAVAHPPLPIPATVIPYKSNSIAPTLPSSSHDHISSSSFQRASTPYFGRQYRPSVSRCCSRRRYGARPFRNRPPLRPIPLLVWFSHLLKALDSRFELGVNWYIPNSRRRHLIPFPILSGVLVSLTTRFIDSAATAWSLTTKFPHFGSVYFFGSPLRPANGRSAPPTLRTPQRE
jgi:hypothetical protein